MPELGNVFLNLSKSLVAFVLSVLMGLFFATLEGWMYENGVIIDEFVTGSISLADIMTFTMIIFIVLGLFVGFIIYVRSD